MVNFSPFCKVLVLMEDSVITRLTVTPQVNEEFTLDGLLRADNDAVHTPLLIDSWFGNVITILLLAAKRFARFMEKV